jgi:hypothetical protein
MRSITARGSLSGSTRWAIPHSVSPGATVTVVVTVARLRCVDASTAGEPPAAARPRPHASTSTAIVISNRPRRVSRVRGTAHDEETGDPVAGVGTAASWAAAARRARDVFARGGTARGGNCRTGITPGPIGRTDVAHGRPVRTGVAPHCTVWAGAGRRGGSGHTDPGRRRARW